MKLFQRYYSLVQQQILQIFSANMLKAGAGFVGTIFVLRGWSASDIGDIYTLVGVLLLLNQIGDLGTGSSFIQLVTHGKIQRQQAFTQSYLGFKQLVSIGFFIASLMLFVVYLITPQVKELLGLGFVVLAASINIYSSFFTILITSRQQFFQLSLMKVIPPSVKSIFIIFLYFAGFRSFFWILFAFLIPVFMTFIMGYFFTRYPFYKAYIKKIFTSHGQKLYEISKWIFFIGFLNIWFSQIDIFMLKRMSNDYQISQFVGAQRISTVILMLSQSIFTVMLPKMRSFSSDSELLKLNSRIFVSYLALIALAIPVTFLAPYLISFFLGGRYLSSIPLLKVFIFNSLGYMFISTQSLIFYRKNRLPTLVVLSAIQLALNFIGNYMVIIDHKALGVICVSTVLNNLFFGIMSLYCFFLLRVNRSKNSKQL